LNAGTLVKGENLAPGACTVEAAFSLPTFAAFWKSGQDDEIVTTRGITARDLEPATP
jgi:hypothetical protein